MENFWMSARSDASAQGVELKCLLSSCLFFLALQTVCFAGQGLVSPVAPRLGRFLGRWEAQNCSFIGS